MISKSPQKFSIKSLLYISYILHPKYPIYFFPTYMYFVFLQVKKQKTCCNVIPCPFELIEHYLNKYTDSAFDASNCVVVPEALTKDIINNSFNLVKLHLKNNNADFRIVHAIPESSLTANEILVSENLFYNINQVNYVNKMRVSAMNQSYIKIAKDVEVALINVQHEINHDIVNNLLKNYFQTPRILYKHDIFSVNLAKYAPQYVCSSFQLSDIENLYFKCKKISSSTVDDSLSGYFCVMGESDLRQGANIRGYLPASIFKLCNKDCLLNDDAPYEECIISNCPHGLGDSMTNIEKAMHPFLSKSK